MPDSFYSQCGQDQWVHQYFQGKTNGVFVDVGAHDGVTFSNTYHFEKDLQWTGICIEANPKVYTDLVRNRKCLNLNCCVSNIGGTSVDFLQLSGYTEMLSGIVSTYDQRHLARIDRELAYHGGTKKVLQIPQRTLGEICEEHGITSIDYLSIDTEGCEYQIIQGLNLSQIQVELIDVENNYPDTFIVIDSHLKGAGYTVATVIGQDVIYRKAPR